MQKSLKLRPIAGHLLRRVKRSLEPTPFVVDPAGHAFLASFPRSGNTWLRCVLFHYTLGRAPSNLAEIDFQIPDEHSHLNESDLITDTGPDQGAPRIVKTHAMFRVDRGYRRAVHIVRHPGHVLPSYYRYFARKQSDLNFETFIENCVLGSQWPGSWHDHTISWMKGAEGRIENFDTVRYEDLVARDAAATEAFAVSLGLADPARLAELMAHYSLDKMRELEAAGNRKTEPAYAKKGQNFIGAGKAPEEQFELVTDLIRTKAPHWTALLDRFGYAI